MTGGYNGRPTAPRVPARAAYADGRVGGWLDTRILSTDRAYNYKLAATLDALRGYSRDGSDYSTD